MASYVDIIKKSQTPQRHGQWTLGSHKYFGVLVHLRKKEKNKGTKNLKTPYY